MTIPAFYFDGKTSRKYAVFLTVEDGTASLTGDIERHCPIGQLRVSERLNRAARKVTFPDGAYLEVQDNPAFNALLSATRHRDSLVVRIQQNWRATLAALATLVLVVVLGYVYLLPAAANLIAKSLPVAVDRQIGQGTLEFLDRHMLAPTKLPAARREALIARFRTLTMPAERWPEYRILFRQSKIGPNAFALPSGDIVLTDEIVLLLQNDDAIMGVLAHELGHLHERHLMRRLIQSSAIGAAATVLFGDVSAVVANIPTVLLDMKYSRDAEREADDYAIAMFKANGMSRAALASVFEKLGGHESGGKPVDGKDGEQAGSGEGMGAYLSSHPSSAERVQRILQAP